MNEQRIQELKAALGQIINMVSQMGDSLTDEIQGMLAQVLEHVASRIQQLRAEEERGAAPPTPTPPQMDEGMASSNVEGFSYDDKTGKLFVRFLGDYPNREGPVYQYEGVPPVIFDLFRRGAVPARTDGQNRWGEWWRGKQPSLGASLFTLIRGGNFPYQRVA